MSRCPKMAELKAGFGGIVGDLLEAMGVTDDDLPDIMPDDLPDDPETLARCFPAVYAKAVAFFPEEETR